MSRPQGHSAARSIMSMENSSDTIGNRTRDLPACSAVLVSCLGKFIYFGLLKFSHLQNVHTGFGAH